MATFVEKLSQAVTEHSDKQCERFRQYRALMLKSYAGSWYGLNDGQQQYQPLNLLHQMVTSLVPSLRLEPKASVTTRKLELRPFAEKTRLALQFLIQELQAANVFHMAMLDAMFGRGVVMVSLAPEQRGKLIEPMGYLDDPGRPVLRNIWEHNYIDDMSAEDEDAVTFRGHRFRIPFETAEASGLYKRDALLRLKDASDKKAGERKDIPTSTADQIIDTIELATLWLPKQNMLVTLPGDMTLAREFLREDEYYGPERGPYEVLTFGRVPGSMMPIPPVSVVWDLVKLINGLVGKIRDGAQSYKRGVMVKPGAAGEAQAVQALDTGGIVYGDPTNIKEFQAGGVDERLYQAVAFLNDYFNRGAKNPDLMGGARAGSNTATQDKLLFDSASVGLSELRARYQRFQSVNLRKLAWHLWHDTEQTGLSIDLAQSAGGVELPVQWTPDEREGDFEDYAFEVESYSAAGQSPDEQYARFKDFVTSLALPLFPMAAQQGNAPQVSEILAAGGAMIDVPDVEQWLAPAPPQQMAQPDVTVQGSEQTVNLGRRGGMVGGVRNPEMQEAGVGG
jgi:hypothetical protein